LADAGQQSIAVARHTLIKGALQFGGGGHCRQKVKGNRGLYDGAREERDGCAGAQAKDADWSG